MQDIVNTVALLCASIASLALGVLVAFWICRTGFALMRAQALARSGQENPIPAKPQVLEA